MVNRAIREGGAPEPQPQPKPAAAQPAQPARPAAAPDPAAAQGKGPACPVCKGKKTVAYEERHRKHSGTMTCPHCDGTGQDKPALRKAIADSEKPKGPPAGAAQPPEKLPQPK